ncbi:SCP domain-containing protein [Fusarium keratoplasticum]|uniref:SCP domain-containing protein n=1 Tax=Fusarium keratoplasticum TaxID=1328300 RepID=A0ACC0RBI6_9HYPO|nr:SCP domain-containing protein [Fusarium keratoplasticum]KAI8679993.1 SCP domain-containing protein [Fusarium keratoplasticum]
MKASMFLVGASAILASASPIRAPLEKRLEKRVLTTEWVYEYVTVTVTEGDAPETEKPAPTAVVFLEEPSQPAPEPTTQVKKPVSRRPKQQPTTKEAPAPKPTYVEPEPEPVKEEPSVVVVTTKQEPTTKEEAKPVATEESGSSSGSYDLSLEGDYKSIMLNYHNIHRSNHSAPDLVWDETLAGYAENTANGCVFEHDMNQGNGGYGQNLASWGATGDIDDMQKKSAAGGITNQWYNSEMGNWAFYGQENPPDGMDIQLYGHFTQVVWKDSTKVGCATVKCPAGSVLQYPSWYTVCNYNPQGNFGGRYGDNVLQPKGEKRVTV